MLVNCYSSISEGTQKAPNNREIEKRILDKVMNTKVYDNKIRPVGAGGEGEHRSHCFLPPK